MLPFQLNHHNHEHGHGHHHQEEKKVKEKEEEEVKKPQDLKEDLKKDDDKMHGLDRNIHENLEGLDMNNREVLIQLLEKHGFVNVNCVPFRLPVPLSIDEIQNHTAEFMKTNLLK